MFKLVRFVYTIVVMIVLNIIFLHYRPLFFSLSSLMYRPDQDFWELQQHTVHHFQLLLQRHMQLLIAHKLLQEIIMVLLLLQFLLMLLQLLLMPLPLLLPVLLLLPTRHHFMPHMLLLHQPTPLLWHTQLQVIMQLMLVLWDIHCSKVNHIQIEINHRIKSLENFCDQLP